MIPARSRRGGIVAVVLGLIITLGVSCNGFREDEVECEQAVNRLEECCPGFVTQPLDCSYSERIDCNDNVTGRQHPALSLDESSCIQSAACADLVANGVCERAQKARPTVTSTGTSSPSSAPTEAVCR